MLSKIKNFYSIEQLYNMSFSCIPEKKGIYIVKKSKEVKIEFSMDTTAIWQIAKSKTLLLGFIECDNPEKIEKELLEEYESKYKVLPVANWRK